MKFLKAFGRFWYDFVIGDDWKIAVAVVFALILLLTLITNHLVADKWLGPVGGVLVIISFCVSLMIDTRHDKKDR